MQTFSREQVLGMAQDAAAAKAAHVQASSVRWTGLGHDELAVWGECRGSGTSQYQCKHALGLLLLLSGGDVPAGHCPDWVAQWLGSRAARAARKPSPARDTAAGPADPEARLRRAASRDRKVDDGVEELRR